MLLARAFCVSLVVSVVAIGLSAQSQRPLDPDQVPVMPAGPEPQFRSGTVLVPIDVRVVDKAGQAVTDLTSSDFSILEDGVPQKIEHFALQRFSPEAVTSASAAPAGLPRAANAFEMTSPNRRTFLILLGRGLLQEPSKGIDAMIHLVREVAMPQDYIAVMAWNRATDFTTDREQLLGILERFKKESVGIELQLRLTDSSLERLYGDGGIPKYMQDKIDGVFGGPRRPGVRTMDRDAEMAFGADRALRRVALGVLEPATSRDPLDEWVRRMYGESLDEVLRQGASEIADLSSLLMAIEHLRVIGGQKQIMFVSEYGFSRPYVDEVVMVGRRAADARVTMNFIHAGGMWSGSAFTAESRTPPSLTQLPAVSDLNIRTSQDARTVTTLSGGQYFAHRHGNSATDVDLMDQATRSQYTLGYYPLNDPIDGKYRKLQVKVLRPNVTVLARDGYYARAHVGPVEMKGAIVLSRVTSAAGRHATIPDIGVNGLTITARQVPTREASVSMKIDLSRVYFEKKNGLNVGSIDVAVFVVTNRDREAGQMWQNLNLSYSDAQLEEVLRTGLPFDSVVPLTAAPQAVKVVVYDYSSDLLGSAVAKVGRN